MRALVFLLALFWAGCAFATPSHVQNAACAPSFSGATFSCTITATGSGNTLLIGVTHDSSGAATSVSSCTDSASDSATILDQVNVVANAQNNATAIITNVTAGATSVSCTLNASNTGGVGIVIDEYSGVASNSLDQHGMQTQTTTSPASPSVTPGQTGELIWGYGQNDDTGDSITAAGTGFTLRNSGAGVLQSTEDQVEIGSSAIAAIFTNSGALATTIAVVTLKPSVGGGGSGAATHISSLLLMGCCLAKEAGSNASGGGTPDGRLPCNFYVAASGGNDSGPGTQSQPFATLEKLQIILQGQLIGNKVGCLEGGRYNRTAPLILTSADNGETWETDPIAAINTAILDGGATVQDIFRNNGGSNLTFNGLQLQHCIEHCIHNHGGNGFTDGGGTVYPTVGAALGNTFENLLCHDYTDTQGTPQGCIHGAGNIQNTTVTHNAIWNGQSAGINMSTFPDGAGDNFSGTTISFNVIYNVNSGTSDTGAIYTRDVNEVSSNILIDNNYIWDFGGATSPAHFALCIYLDDGASNHTIKRNICGGSPGLLTGPGALNHAMQIHGGRLNTVTSNIFDIPAFPTSSLAEALLNFDTSNVVSNGAMDGNNWNSNLVVSKYTGTSCPAFNIQGGPANLPNIQHNMYFNFSTGTVCDTGDSGASSNDHSPITGTNPNCSTYLDTLAGNSPVFNAPMSMLAISATWGPSGYTIPAPASRSPTGTVSSCL